MKQVKRGFLEQVFVNIDEGDNRAEIEMGFSDKGFYLRATRYIFSDASGITITTQLTFERTLNSPSFACPDCGYKVQPEEFFEISE